MRSHTSTLIYALCQYIHSRFIPALLDALLAVSEAHNSLSVRMNLFIEMKGL